MESSLIFVIIVGGIIWAIVLLLVIRSATHSDRILNHNRMQTKLLIEMAKKAGVAQETIDTITHTK